MSKSNVVLFCIMYVIFSVDWNILKLKSFFATNLQQKLNRRNTVFLILTENNQILRKSQYP